MVTSSAIDNGIDPHAVEPVHNPTLIPVIPLPFWKRAFDVAVAGTALILASPLAIVLALVTLTVTGRPLLYRQARGGLGGTTFEILKLRTMRNAFDDAGRPLSDEQRRHRWGNFLRRTSLDEIPTLINILRGDMSVVGPRPLMARYLDRYSEQQARRHCVTPGVTGLAQTRGRNKLGWAERFELDLAYVETRSVATDIRILFDTVKVVLTRDGADGNDHCTEFQGLGGVEVVGVPTPITVVDDT